MADACFRFAPIARERSRILERLGLEPGAYVVATIHREANVRPERLARILDGLGRVAEPVVFPAHPRTRSLLGERAAERPARRAARLPRHGRARLAGARDRDRLRRPPEGGLLVRRPVRDARPSTEWVDTVEVGANVLVDDDPERLAAGRRGARALPGRLPELYGDGHASERVAAALRG